MTSKRYFYGWAKRNEIVEKSSSGGLFYILAENVIQEGGSVFGAAIEKDGNVILKSASTLVELNWLLGSKYVQAEVGDVYNEINCGKCIKVCPTNN